MRNLNECVHCGDSFDLRSPQKIRAGGKINECPTCVQDFGLSGPPKYLGVGAGDGKMTGVTILKFETEQDRAAYAAMWRNNSGQNKGKSCQLGTHLTASSGLRFTTVQKTEAVNHKGKL
jgi:hypothetical protein